jgi:hypothetical protein
MCGAVGAPATKRGIRQIYNIWPVRQPFDDAWSAAATGIGWAEGRYYAAAVATVAATLALLAAPVLVASLAIVGILR